MAFTMTISHQCVNYEVKSTEIKPYSYNTPLITIDGEGKPRVQHSNQPPIHIKKLILLNLVGRNKHGKIVSYEPIEQVNRFLMAHHIDEDKQESEQYSKALIHFFSFLIESQKQWDAEYDEDLFDECVDLPRPAWDHMPVRKSQRITYQYRTALIYSVTKERDDTIKLSRSTATAYMNAVIKFYSYHLANGHPFNNPPFTHEVVDLHYQGGSASMKSYLSKTVHTSDLRLNFPRSKRNEGGTIPSRRDLKPLSNLEWASVENILLKTRRIIKNVKGHERQCSLAIEYCLFFLLSRYTGLRKEEVASLHRGQIVRPNREQLILRLGVGDNYGSLTKTRDGGNKSRKTIIPSQVMQLIYEYTLSERYRNRLAKFKALCVQKRDNGDDGWFDSEDGVDENKDYLFISATGKPFFTKPEDLNTRWNEIRATAAKEIGAPIDGVIHNLRSTFAVALFRVLLRKTSPDTALAMVSQCLGHDDEKTTLKYLKIAQDVPTGDEIYEDILDHIGVFDDLKLTIMDVDSV
jgi:integrase